MSEVESFRRLRTGHRLADARGPGAERAAILAVLPAVSLLLVAVLLAPSSPAPEGLPSRPRTFQLVVCAASALSSLALMAGWFRQQGIGPAALGIGRVGLRGTLIELALPTAAILALLLAWTATRAQGWQGIEPPGPGWLGLVPVYLGWAVVQQVVILGYVFGRLLREGLGQLASVLLTTFLFASFHLPNPGLVGITLVSGLFWTSVYARHGNLLGVAISHALTSLVGQELLDVDMHTGIHYLERLELG